MDIRPDIVSRLKTAAAGEQHEPKVCVERLMLAEAAMEIIVLREQVAAIEARGEMDLTAWLSAPSRDEGNPLAAAYAANVRKHATA